MSHCVHIVPGVPLSRADWTGGPEDAQKDEIPVLPLLEQLVVLLMNNKGMVKTNNCWPATQSFCKLESVAVCE